MLPLRSPVVEMPQFHIQHRCLDTIHPIVVADIFMQVSGSLAMTTQRSGELRNFVVVGRERSAFAVCTQVLARIKTERGGMSEPANSLPAVTRSVRLACIFDQQQSVIGCDFCNGTEVCRPAIQMHGNDGTSSFGNCLFNLCGINVCCCGINISKDRSRSHIADR